jgi:hypothetical protein
MMRGLCLILNCGIEIANPHKKQYYTVVSLSIEMPLLFVQGRKFNFISLTLKPIGYIRKERFTMQIKLHRSGGLQGFQGSKRCRIIE